ncbi:MULTISPECIES: cation diffusion facilitator family transporter [Devosia]|uniref:Cation diffusion facilitator family transporter n=1 Tax=Devosia salina TaxID=2860336 RepID=A0ABX8WCH6_9HYPH|nr:MULTISPECIES: cation diffusion facilitator family transporter [Devosia]AVF05110.1 cation transporter [Devosia sp. I507]QYO76583.1 cation diffusion facilitator family transporter [Devosia salina]
MAHSHGGSADRSPDRGRRLLIALALNLGITVAEVVGGVVSGSLALIADAAHNFSDAASVLVSYIAWRISRRAANEKRTFGYARAETVGALINLTTLIIIGLYLLYEAGARLLEPTEVVPTAVIIVGVIAFVEDVAAAWVLRKDLGSLNVRSTFLHMIADALATVAVIISGVSIMVWGPDVYWIDPAVTAAIAIYVLIHGSREIREAITVLMDSAPKGFEHDRVVAKLRGLEGVIDVHHLHVWQISEGKTALQVHLALDDMGFAEATELKERLKRELHDEFEIEHATIEMELAAKVDHDAEIVAREE